MLFSIFSNFFKKSSPSKDDIDERFNNIILEFMGDLDYETACLQLSEFVEDYPNHNDAVNMLGKYLIRSGKIKEGLKILRDHLEIMENDAETWLILGGHFENERNYENALQCFEKILELSPENWKFNYRVSTIHLSLKNYDKTIEYMEKFLEHESNDAESYLFLGEAYKENGEIDRAILNYEKSLELDDGSFIVPGELIKLYAQKGNLKEKYTILINKVERLKHDHFFKIDYGKALEMIDDLEAAAIQYTDFGEYYFDLLVEEDVEEIRKNYKGILSETLINLKRVKGNPEIIKKWEEIMK